MAWYRLFFSLVAIFIGFIAISPRAWADSPWLRAKSPHFIVYSKISEHKTLSYVQHLEKFRYLLSALYGFSIDQSNEVAPFTIYLVQGSGDLEETWPKIDPIIRGYYTGCQEDQAAFAIYDGENQTGQLHGAKSPQDTSLIVLLHEYAHAFMYENDEEKYPPWFVEGYAEFYSTMLVKNGNVATVGLSSPWRYATLKSGVFDLDYAAILRDDDLVHSDDDSSAAYYAQSWLLTHYILSDPKRRIQFRDYLAQTAKGTDPVTSFEAAFGIPIKSLRSILSNYLNNGLYAKSYELAALKDVEISITRLPDSSLHMTLWHAAASICRSFTRSPEFLKKFQNEARSYPNDDFAQTRMAHVELLVGDERKAATYLSQHLMQHPDDAEAMAWLGEAYYMLSENNHMIEGESHAFLLKQARFYMSKAYQRDPLNATNLYYLSLAQKDVADFPNDLAINAALQAHYLRPGVTSYSWYAAQLLIARDRFDEARLVLIPLSGDPHNRRGAEYASKAIKAIEDGADKSQILVIFNEAAQQD